MTKPKTTTGSKPWEVGKIAVLGLCLSIPLSAHADNPSTYKNQTVLVSEQGFDGPISGHMNGNDIFYIVSRCSGLMISALSVSQEGSGIYQLLYQRLELFHALSMGVLENDYGYSAEAAKAKTTNSSSAFARTYIAYVNDAYTRSGNYLSHPMVMDDLETCGQVVKALQN